SPGTLAIAIPMCRSAATGCASAAMPCWKRCCAGLGLRLCRSKPPSTRSPAPMSIIRMRTRDKRRSQRGSSAPKLLRQDVRVGPRPASKKAALAAIADTAELHLAALYRLMTWLSPAYPIGAFSYSSGIEWAVEHGDIHNAATLQAWLSVVIGQVGCFCDWVFFVHAHRAAAADDTIALRRTAELALAMAPSKERYLETSAQGRAFLETTRAAWPAPALDRLAALVEGDVALPVA